MINVKDFGAVGDGVADDTVAFLSALQASDPDLYVPSGTYKISEDLPISKWTRLFGEGGAPRRARTVLSFVNGGIVIISEHGDAAMPNGRGSRVYDLAVHRASNNASHAIRMEATAHLERCSFVGGASTAIYVDGLESSLNNSNGWEIRSCTFEDVRGWAIETHGSDANAGVADHCSAVSCDGGFYDGSFLGSRWMGCHAEGCTTLGGYLCDGQAARAYFQACYCESDSANIWIGPIATVDGGTLGAVMRSLPSYSVQYEQHKGAWRDGKSSGHTTWTTYGAAGNIQVALGVPDGRTVLQWQAGEDPHEVSVKAEHTAHGPVYALEGANTTLLCAASITRSGHVAGPYVLTVPRGVWSP